MVFINQLITGGHHPVHIYMEVSINVGTPSSLDGLLWEKIK